MTDSILQSIKKMIGIAETDTYFDPDIIMHINSVIAILTQVGVGPSTGFRIEDDVATWTDLLLVATNLDFVKSFMHIRVKLLFDPPQNTATIELMKEQAKEFLWRIETSVD